MLTMEPLTLLATIRARGGLCDEPDALEVSVYDAVPGTFVLFERRFGSGDPGIVNHRMDRTEGRFCLRHRRINLCHDGDVEHHALRLAAGYC